jgi:hypothetical protein
LLGCQLSFAFRMQSQARFFHFGVTNFLNYPSLSGFPMRINGITTLFISYSLTGLCAVKLISAKTIDNPANPINMG